MSIPNLTDEFFLVDNSTIELITTCPWLAYAKVIRKRVPAGESPALRFGQNIHAALAYRYRRMALGKPADDDVINRILTKRFERSPCESEDWRNVNMATAVLLEYGIKYANENLTIPFVKGFPFVEKPFSVYAGDVGRRRIIYIGRVDLAYVEGHHHYIRDHKTSSMLGDSYWKDTAMSEQQRGYCWSYREITGNEPTGYQINVLACRRPTRTGTSIEFQRQTTFTKEPPGQLDEWRENMLAQVATFLWQVDRGYYPRHHKHCVHKYGVCPFYNVCELPPQSREVALASSEYKDNDWSPLYR